MKVLVDSSVWSLALRRAPKSPKLRAAPDDEARELARLIVEGNVGLIGPIRQEVLSGIREAAQFERLRSKLAEFPDAALHPADFETAAQFFNRCRAKGLQGSNIDFLICAVSARSWTIAGSVNGSDGTASNGPRAEKVAVALRGPPARRRTSSTGVVAPLTFR